MQAYVYSAEYIFWVCVFFFKEREEINIIKNCFFNPDKLTEIKLKYGIMYFKQSFITKYQSFYLYQQEYIAHQYTIARFEGKYREQNSCCSYTTTIAQACPMV